MFIAAMPKTAMARSVTWGILQKSKAPLAQGFANQRRKGCLLAQNFTESGESPRDVEEVLRVRLQLVRAEIPGMRSAVRS